MFGFGPIGGRPIGGVMPRPPVEPAEPKKKDKR